MIGPYQPLVYTPFLPALDPYVLPPAMFEAMIEKFGIRLLWLKGHLCPCVYGGPTPGTPDFQCITCRGRGYYWDNPIGPFQGLITFIHTSPTPDEPGAIMDTSQGLIVNGEPALTIPHTSLEIWQEAALFDMFVEIDAINRFNADLQVGGINVVPYQQSLSIAPSGAVTIYDTSAHAVVSGVSYTVSGAAVTLDPSYGTGTNFVIEFKAAPAYIAYRVAGAPAHVRPFAQSTQPRRYRLQTLDLFTRARFQGDIPIGQGLQG